MKKIFPVLLLALLSLMSFTLRADAPKISILGDSYSTFNGWIPKGNSIWYPNKNNDVKKVESCWWYLTVEMLGGKLEKNESWSGSTICYIGYHGNDASSFSFVERVNRLGDPDLILICGATNDSWAGSPIGEYKWENWTRQDLFSFRPAMAKMLYDIKARYPEARVVFMLNNQLKPAINESVHEICKHYNVLCVDLKDIDKQSGHPSVKGMKQMAEQVVAAIKK